MRWGRGTVPIFPTFAMPDVDQHARAVDILHLQRGALLQAQPTGGERGEADSGAKQADTAEHRSHLFEAQDHWQFFLARGAHKAEGSPVSVEGVLEEARDAAQGNRARAARVVLDMLEGEEIVAECFLADHVWGLVRVLRQLAHGSDGPSPACVQTNP